MNIDIEKAYVASMPYPFYVIADDADTTIIYANHFFYEMIDRSEDEVTRKYGGRLSALVNPDDLSDIKNKTSEAEISSRLRFRKKDNTVVWTETCMIPADGGRFFCFSYNITRYKEPMDRLKEEEYKCRFIMSKTKSYMFEYDPAARLLRCHSHKYFVKINGGVIDNFPESYIESGLIHNDSIKDFTEAFASMTIGSIDASSEVRLKDGYGNYKWYQLTMEKTVFGDDHKPHIIGVLEDISKRKEAYIAYLRETQFYRTMLADNDAWGDVDITENKITRVGGLWSSYNDLISTMTYNELAKSYIKKVVHPSDRDNYLAVMDRQNLIDSQNNGITKLGCEFRRIVKQNKMVWMRITLHLFTDPINGHVTAVLYLTNIDGEKKKELLLQRESKRDALTDLFNKRMTETSIKEFLINSGKNTKSALIIVDLDNFKEINDSYGHSMGDRVLIRAAGVFKQAFRKDDIIGRFGGDEFVIFMKNIASQGVVEDKIKEVQSILIGFHDIQITCSMGAVLSPKYGTNYGKLFQYADIALYSSKRCGKDRLTFYRGTETAEENSPAQSVKNERRHTYNTDFEDDLEEITEKKQNNTDFNAFLSELGEIAYLVDPYTFELILGNKAFYDRIGLVQEECKGMKCYELLQNRTSSCPFCSKVNWNTEKFYVWKNHNPVLEQDFLIKNKLVNWDGAEVMLAISVDISNNKNMPDFMEDSINVESVLLGCVYKMTEMDTLEDSIATALETIAQFYKANKAQLWEKSLPSGKFVLSSEYTTKESTTTLPISYERTISEWLSDHPATKLWINSPDEMLHISYEMYNLMKSTNITNYCLMPLADKNEIFGFISIEGIGTHNKVTAFIESLKLFLVKEIQKFRREGTIEYMRRHDTLTGLPNRISYEAYTASFCSDRLASIGILAANINGLNKLNNTAGYEKGNEVIKECSAIISKIFTECRIFRHSGDEFIIAAENITREAFDAKALLLKNFIERSDKVSLAFGYVWDDADKDLGLLIWHAYELMKMNKRMYYNSGKASPDPAKYEMLSNLISNLESGDFLVFFQPKKDLATGLINGAEALIRYRENDGSITPPVKFLGNLEAKGMIRYVDLFVFEEVCKFLERWKREKRRKIKISVNFSRITLLESDIVANVESIVKKYSIDIRYIEIEITESVSDMGKSILCRIASDFKKAGFSISLDDFGTKYTNLSILADISFDVLKLDKSLINTIAAKEANKIIIKSIISMCNELGTETIAEGVETLEQEKILKSLGCRSAQGYLYGRPMEIYAFEKLV